jgi:hypothetical protein
MSRILDIITGGKMPAGTAKAINLGLVETGLSGAGTSSQANAAALTVSTSVHIFTTVALNSGCRLATTAEGSVPGDVVWVVNGGANPLFIYPGSGEILNDLAANTAVDIPAGSAAILIRADSTQWAIVAGTA